MTRRQVRGFTLIELTMVVVILGIVAVLSVYGVRKYVATAKSAEARNALGQIAKDAAAAFERNGQNSTNVAAKGALSDKPRRLCPSASASVPATITQVTGREYPSKASDWSSDRPSNAGFYCLAFSLEEPQSYMYSYALTGTGTAAGDGFAAIAQGDVDGNGVTSVFTLRGQIDASLALDTPPQILEVRPDE